MKRSVRFEARRFLGPLVIVAGAWLTAACGPPFQFAQPPGFVEVENDYDDYDFRATSADGLVLGARELDNEEGGTVEFWVKAIENQMRGRGGYALLDKKDVQTADGLSGVQLRFGFDQDQTPRLYYVTLLVTEEHIYLLEAGGTKALVEQHAEQIDWSVRNFRE